MIKEDQAELRRAIENNDLNDAINLTNSRKYGTLHRQVDHAIEFFSQSKVVIERWPKEWSRKF